METIMKIFKALIALSMTLVASSPALAMLTSDQMDQIDRMMASSGYYSSGSSNYGRLDKSTSSTSTIQASTGKNYAVVAVCDADCSDIDIRVTDKYGDVVGEDVDNTDMALILFRANYSGTYTLKTTMYNCQTSYCMYRTKTYIER